MQPHRSGTRTAVETESEWALARLADVILGISDIEYAGLGCAVFELQEDGAGGRGIFDLLPANFDGMFCLNDFFFRSWGLLFLFELLRRFFWRGLLLREAQIHPKKKYRGGA